MWVLLALVSAVLLGLYQSLKKFSVNGNAVLPVLFGSILVGACLVFPIVTGSFLFPETFRQIGLYVPDISAEEHGLIFLKAVVVVSSWIFAFHAMKHLPLTIVTPIQATGPVWTLAGAILIFQEKLNPVQWIGVTITLLFFYLLSTAGKTEGVNFKKNRWIFFLIAGILLSAASGLYDKFIIRRIDRLAVQAWFSFYQVLVMLPAIAIFRWAKPKEERPPFQWRWSIPAIGVFLLLADFAYFYALSDPDSMISIISALRRGGALISFAIGAIFFNERNIRSKAVYLCGILTGILMISLGSD
ncbi:MAG: EamA family transporter [Prolixibacteraceae bacterium]